MELIDISGLKHPDAKQYREAVQTAIWRREEETGGGPVALSRVVLTNAARGAVRVELYPNCGVERFDRQPFAAVEGAPPEDLHERVYTELKRRS